MKIVLMVFLKEFCSGPISHSRLTNDTSMWFSQKQQQQEQQQKATKLVLLSWAILSLQMAYYDSGSALKIFFDSQPWLEEFYE